MIEQRNLIVAIILSVGILFAFQFFYEMPRLRERQEAAQRAAEQASQAVTTSPAAPGTPAGAPIGDAPDLARSRAEVLAESPRLPIDNGRLHGSVALIGGRIDDISLAGYRQSLDPAAPEIVLLSPAGAPATYFVEHGWVASAGGIPLPDARTRWQVVSGDRLAAGAPVLLAWDNGQGLRFERRLEIDVDYMLTITQTVTNNGGSEVTLFPYGLVSRWGTPRTEGQWILHEGAIGALDGQIRELDYEDVVEEGQKFTSTGGWLGFTDKYWLTALVPDQSQSLQAEFRHNLVGAQDRYQTDYLGPALTLPPGANGASTTRVFVGAKELDKLDSYSAELNLPLFDRAVDFGWFYFLTKPIFLTLDFFYRFTGNYGVSILLLTLLVKLLFFPLANKSYKSMSQMKLLQPKMLEIREKFESDKTRMNQEMMALYKREKVNPVAGCLPIVVQIPVFFSLYKVLFVSIEMRHAPFFGWIRDLSAPDPTSLFNLFGLLPYAVPDFLPLLGFWPILMGGTMFLQTKLNPQPADPMQAKIMLFLPLIFTFLFGSFAAGLVIYWTWNNLLSVAQQWYIMRRMGAKPG